MSATGTPGHSLRVAFRLIWIDLKQGFRKHLQGAGWRDRAWQACGAFLGFSFLAGLHFAAWSLLSYTLRAPTAHQQDLLGGLSTSIWSFLLFVMISGGLVRALVVLHEQDDSNLLLSSPVAPRAILAARLFGNALQSCLVDGFIIVPYIDVRTCTPGFHLNFLWGYLVWFAIAIIVTSVDALFSFGLVAWLGMRRARTFSQAIPFILIFGVTFFAGSVSVNIAQMNAAAGMNYMPPAMQAHFLELNQTPLSWMARAAEGQPLYLVMIFGAAAALGFVTLLLTERAFVEGSQHLAENAAPLRPGEAAGPFRSSLLLLEIHKNLRLVVRTPMMLVQCLAQVLTPVGIAFVLGREDVALGVGFFVIFGAGVLAGIFTIAAGTVEECGDLLLMAPRRPRLFRFGKILSGWLPPAVLTLLTGLGLLVTDNSVMAFAVVFAGIPLALASSLVGEIFATGVASGQRPKLLSDPIMMVPLLGLQITSGLVAGMAIFAASFSFLFLLGALLISYMLLLVLIGLAQLRKPLFA